MSEKPILKKQREVKSPKKASRKSPKKASKKPPVKIHFREIWKVDLSGNIGHEEGKRRPALVISGLKAVGLRTIIPLTGQLNADRFPYTLRISKTKLNGLTKDSVAMIFQLRSCSEKRFVKKIGTLSPKIFDQIKVLVKKYFGLKV
ncbi:MAG: type II toxin-antitoxin system PemK/MazF family toxin [Promethearchaeota archaeon]